MNCSKCGKEIPVDTPPSENWQFFCRDCGIREINKLIKDSKKYYEHTNKGEVNGH